MDITMHHVFSLIIVSYVYFTGKNGWMMVWFIVIGEITNPLLSLGEALEFRGANKKYVLGLQGVFMVSFVYIRTVVVTKGIYELHQQPDVDFFFKFFPAIVTFQGYEWVWMMLNKLGKLAHEVSLILNISL